jgi:L-ascorbate metabolism protein UlaG (beta-lactamase superfamily)
VLRILPRVAWTLIVLAVVAGGAFWQTQLRASGVLADDAAHLIDDRGVPADGAVKVTYLGTTMMLVDDGTTQILIDPFITRIGLFAAVFKRPVSTDEAAVDKALARAGATRVRAIFVSHSHHDHAFDLAYVARRTGALVYGSISTLNIARGGDVPEAQLRQVNAEVPATVGSFTVRVLTSKHSPHPVGGEGATIDAPLRQPAPAGAYKVGGTYDFLIARDDHHILFKGSANFIPGALDGIHADALFLGIAGLGKAPEAFADSYLAATIDTVHPSLVVPTHWNDFFAPMAPPLPLSRKVVDHAPAAFARLLARAQRDHVRFGILDAYGSVLLFQPPDHR